MKVIYIASAYTVGDVAANVAVQMEAAHRIMDMEHCPIAPLLSHFLHLYQQRPYQDWINVDLELIKRCDIVLRLPGVSSGADGEVQLALQCNIPVCYGWSKLEALLDEQESFE